MKRVLISKSALWALVIPIAVAEAYAIFTRLQITASDQGSVASQVLSTVASDPRVQLLVVIPAWAIGSTTAILRASAPGELIRYGSRNSAVLRPLLRCLLIYICSAAAGVALYAVVLFGTYTARDFPFAIFGGFALVGGDVLLVGLFLVCLYAVLALAYLTSKSTRVTVGVALLICFWAVASIFGLVSPSSPVNAGLYVSVDTAIRSGWVPFASVGGALILIAFTWLFGNAVDERQRRSGRAT